MVSPFSSRVFSWVVVTVNVSRVPRRVRWVSGLGVRRMMPEPSVAHSAFPVVMRWLVVTVFAPTLVLAHGCPSRHARF